MSSRTHPSHDHLLLRRLQLAAHTPELCFKKGRACNGLVIELLGRVCHHELRNVVSVRGHCRINHVVTILEEQLVILGGGLVGLEWDVVNIHENIASNRVTLSRSTAHEPFAYAAPWYLQA